ncbi:MAG: hypothetical protein R6V44_11100 [Paracoccaceae bacterium]
MIHDPAAGAPASAAARLGKRVTASEGDAGRIGASAPEFDGGADLPAPIERLEAEG